MNHLTIFILLFAFVGQLNAKEVRNVYSATVNVFEEQGFDKKEAFQKGLEKVIFKLTGVDAAFEDELYDPIKNISNTLVQKYNYQAFSAQQRRQWQKQQLRVGALGLEQVPYATVTVTYAKKPILSFLNRNKIPYWSSLRPLSLFWVVPHKEGDTEPAIIDRYSENDVKQKLIDINQKVALPFILPTMDNIDKQVATVQMVKDFDINALNMAAQKYSAFNIIVADIVKIENTYQISWASSVEQNNYVWDTSSENLYQAILEGVQENIKHLLSTLNEGLVDGDKQQLTIIVENVSDYPSLIGINKYLAKLPKIENLVMSEFDQSVITFKAKLVGSMDSLYRYIKLKHIVKIKEQPEEFIDDSDETIDLDLALDIDEDFVIDLQEKENTLHLVFQ